MRIALISDIHGNLISLDAVLADIKRAGVDRIVFLGDLATLGPQPKQAVARLRDTECDCVMGNHDAYLLDPRLLRSYSDDKWLLDTIDWCIQQLGDNDLDFIRTFQTTLTLPLGADETGPREMLCFHGSPKSNIDIILATTPGPELEKMLRGYDMQVMVGGHTHVQMMRQHEGRLVINAGSVGMPFKKTPFENTPRIMPWAEYTILTAVNGVLSVDLRRVPVDIDAIAQAALESKMPERQDWVKNWEMSARLL